MPGGNKNIKPDDGKQFTSDYQPDNRGRKKNLYTILKEKGYSADDIRTAFGELAWYTADEASQVAQDEEMPLITHIVAKQFLAALKDSNWHKVKEILEHTIGKPTQRQELQHSGSTICRPALKWDDEDE